MPDFQNLSKRVMFIALATLVEKVKVPLYIREHVQFSSKNMLKNLGHEIEFIDLEHCIFV